MMESVSHFMQIGLRIDFKQQKAELSCTTFIYRRLLMSRVQLVDYLVICYRLKAKLYHVLLAHQLVKGCMGSLQNYSPSWKQWRILSEVLKLWPKARKEYQDFSSSSSALEPRTLSRNWGLEKWSANRRILNPNKQWDFSDCQKHC